MTTSSLPDLLTVKEVAELLRLKERKIYDLLSHKQIPCTRVAGKWLFDRTQIDAWLAKNSEMPGQLETVASKPHPAILVGGHDPLIEWALAELDYPFSTQFNGSEEGLNRFAAGEAVICGTHLLDSATGEYNVAAVRALMGHSDVVLVEWAKREEGLILAPGNPLGISAIEDIQTSGARFVERQDGAGSQTLFLQLIQRAGIEHSSLNLSSQKAYSHHEVGFAVASGQADVGVAIQSVAQQMRLEFVPLQHERFDLVIHRRDYFEPPFQQLLDFVRTPAFAAKAQALGGYDVSDIGRVHWNAP